MEYRSSEVKAGFFIFVSTLVLIVMIFVLGDIKDYFKPRKVLRIVFNFTGGMEVGAPVRYAGLDIGSVRDIVLLGDGECHEGTIWESANIGSNQKLGNLCAIVDWNQSAAQLMPIDDLPAKWESFGWDVTVIDGHSESEIKNFFSNLSLDLHLKPKVLIAKTIKGKGVSITEGHGAWHHKVPNDEEFEIIKKELSL